MRDYFKEISDLKLEILVEAQTKYPKSHAQGAKHIGVKRTTYIMLLKKHNMFYRQVTRKVSLTAKRLG